MKKILIIFMAFIICGCTNSIALSETPEIESAPAFSSPDVTVTPSKEPQKTPEPTPEPLSKAQQLLSEMTLEEKIGQLFFVAFRRNKYSNHTVMNEEIEAFMMKYKPGGVILFSENITSASQTKKLITDLKALSNIGLFVGIDEEGGKVVRTSALDLPKIPSAGKMKPEEVSVYASEIAAYLKDLGFNFDFAPVADINTNPKNTVIGDRAFSSDENVAGVAVADFVRVLEQEGIHTSVKHFPGHGDTHTDSHDGFVYVDHDLERLLSKELVPFKAGIDAGATAVMVGHIATPNVTGNDLPAIFQSFLLKDILREKLKFDGLIITDALDMGAVVNYYTSGETAIKCLEAGIDMLLMPQNPEEAFLAVKTAVESGEISVERLDESVLRILMVKYPASLH